MVHAFNITNTVFKYIIFSIKLNQTYVKYIETYTRLQESVECIDAFIKIEIRPI